MYLLIPKAFSVWICISLFTFHNVSINSAVASLHIDMCHGFTFHNVSINSLIFPSGV